MSPEKQAKNTSSNAPEKEEINDSPNQDSLTATSSIKKTSSLAVAALVTAFFFPIVGLVLGIVALNSIKKNNESGRGLAISAIVVSVVITIIGFVIGGLFIYGLSRATNEAGINSLDTKNGSISVTGKDGETASIGKSISIPSGFPSDVPIYKPSDVIFATSSKNDYNVSLLTSDTEAQVSDYYTKQLASNGWVSKSSNGAIVFEGGSISSLEKGDNVLAIFIVRDSKNNGEKTSITISVKPKNNDSY